jgi:ubiquinone/menaquinone biosynthesis C-methylase UbiE
MEAYYDRRAPEYDDYYLGTGVFADVERPGWADDRLALERAVADLAPAHVLDVGCGTGFLTRHLRGDVVGLDRSDQMLRIAQRRVPDARFVCGSAFDLPFADETFDRVFAGHFYGHLRPRQRRAFLAEARRVARELVIADAAYRAEVEPERVEERRLSDGTRHRVYKRYFTGDGLAAELGAGRVLHEGRWFVVVAAPLAAGAEA